ncbi:RHS repeat-associated core domain-containing protein [Priestia flexa]|uniref:RHS repeat-associated core domain-containing protein n=1 Tax=Priestia flexa TaxID=86664 RepID=UPI003D07B35A
MMHDAWGNSTKHLRDNNTDIGNVFTYAGYMYDEETGLYYLTKRFYEPTTGTFLSVDADIGDEDDVLSQNGYIYVNNNPLMYVDSVGNRGFKFSSKGSKPSSSKKNTSKNSKNKSKNLPNKLTITKSGEKHVKERHIRQKAEYKHKSRWTVTGGQWKTYARDTFKKYKKVTRQTDGYIRYEKKYSKNIGVDKNGKKLKYVRVVVDKNGNLITAFPADSYK